MNVKHKIIYAFLIFIMHSGCLSHQTNALNDFLEKVEKHIDRSDLDRFKEASSDSIVWYYTKFEDRIFDLLKDSVEYKKLRNYCDENGLRKDQPALCFALHLKLNNRKFDNEAVNHAVMVEFERLADLRRKEYEKKMQLDEKMAKLNFKNCQLGDLIVLKFPVSKEKNRKLVMFNVYDAQDSVELEGRLAKIDVEDSGLIYFTVKLTHISDKDCVLHANFFHDHKGFGFNLNDYPRVIAKKK